MLKLIHGLSLGRKGLLDWNSYKDRGDTYSMKRSFYFVTATAVLGASVMFGAARQDTKAGDPAKGKDAFEQCSVCHNVDTDEKKIGPSLKGLFKQDKLVN